MTVSEFDAQMHKMIMRYPEQVSLVQMNFLDTHDVPRFLSYCVGDRRRLRLAYFISLWGMEFLRYSMEMSIILKERQRMHIVVRCPGAVRIIAMIF